MGTKVPADDLPSGAVPADDLPDNLMLSPEQLRSPKVGVVGGLEAAAQLGSQIASSPIQLGAGIAGLILPGPEGQGADYMQKAADLLTYEPRTQAGKQIGEVAQTPGRLLGEGIRKAGEFAADKLGPEAGALTEGALQVAPMLLGRGIAKAGGSPEAIAARAKAMKLGEPVQAGLEAANQAGLAVTPTEAGAGVLGRTAESVVGSERLQKLNSRKNASTFNDIIRNDVGLPDDVPISREALAEIRKTEGQNYDAVKKIGRVDTDVQYASDLSNITKSYDTAATDFAHRSENPFAKVMEGLKRDSFDATSAVEEVKLLRADANKAYANKDAALGKAFKSAAQALDDQLARQVTRSNLPPDTVSKYLRSRTIIAKTYAADAALNETTGNINAAKYAQMLDRKKPLDSGALQVAKFAKQFPKSSQVAEKLGPTGATIHDLALGGLGHLAFGGAGYAAAGAIGLPAAALALVRPVGRSVIASRPYQLAQRSLNRKTGKQGLSRHAGRAGTLASLAEQHEPPSNPQH